MDCFAGGIMGWACWQAWDLAAPSVESWVERGHWTGGNLDMLHVLHRSYSYMPTSVPLISIVVCLTLVHKHPEPVDGKLKLISIAIQSFSIVLYHQIVPALRTQSPSSLSFWDHSSATGILRSMARLQLLGTPNLRSGSTRCNNRGP